MKRTTIFAVAVLLLAAMTMSVHAATITVTNTNDSGPGSLRQALTNANNGDRINFEVTGAIMLTSDELVVSKSITISGPGADQLSINASNTMGGICIFHILSGEAVTISGLTITSGGTGICNDQAILTVRNCFVTNNSQAGFTNNASLSPNAITSLTITNSLFSNNDLSIINQSESSKSLVSNNGPSIVNRSEPRNPGLTRTITSGSTLLRKPAGDGSGAGNCTACMTIANSVVTGDHTAIFNVAYAPRAATVTVLDTTFTDNLGGIGTYGFGGHAEVTLKNSTIIGISSNVSYSAIDSGFSSVSIANSTIRDGGSGLGGINVRGSRGLGLSVSIVNSTISGNTFGGGIQADGLDDLSIVNSTISGNSANTGTGGGIYNFNSSLRITNSTITGNSAASGGGIYNDGSQGASIVEISNTILNAGASGENIFNNGGTVTSDGYNLSSDDGGGYLTGPGDQINTDPLLSPLGDNGGPTFTHALLPGSPAIDAGDPNFSPPPFNDQRGCPFDRVFNGRIDIGSYETQPQSPRPHPCQRPRPTPPPRP
ncbi:MAG: choice-of-anchor Q domain-containing protein [Candidatus Udaeobacter sp.]